MSIDEYFDELMYEIRFEEDGYFNYSKLMKYLFERKFVPRTELDENRIGDVFSILRMPFECLENERDVSILEMLIAMCIRIGESVVGDENTAKYFWMILDNLDLLYFEDDIFDEREVSKILDVWLNKKYSKDGKGSPWPIKKAGVNLLEVDIWRHFCMYIAENFM